MPSPIADSLDALATWRSMLDKRVAQLGRSLKDSDLLDDSDTAIVSALRERLSGDKLVLAFVAEFSRGKSELINAIFFADAGRRVLPATPGRTTMCPVELRFDTDVPPRLALLPIETRLRGLSLSELRRHDEPWQHLALDPQRPESLVQALSAVTRTQWVDVAQAEALGLWNESQPEDNPPRNAEGLVEVPAWRHAVINYPHPLLQRGLVVVDTPGLNAVGAEPELTLGLLPSAHAVVFVLAADTGVTRSDLSIWQEHLSQSVVERFVVLNKIDTLADPLLSSAEVQAQIEQQRQNTARTLGVAPERVFAVSAREALASRVESREGGQAHGERGGTQVGAGAAGDAGHLASLEQALATELLPRRRQLLVASAVSAIEQLRQSAVRRLADRRRQQAEQLLELRGLRGKSGGKLRLMVGRVDMDMADFERCTARLAAMRAVQARILRTMLSKLSSDSLRAEVTAMHGAMSARAFILGGRAAFDTLVSRLGTAMQDAAAQGDEMRQMLEGSFRELNTDFGFVLSLPPLPTLSQYTAELDLIAHSYGRYLGLGQAWRMAAPGFAEQFRRMLLSKLRVVFECAAGELEMWSKASTGQIEAQMRERRRGFARRRDSLLRVQSAAGELEQRIDELQTMGARIDSLQARMESLVADTLRAAGQLEVDLDLDLWANDTATPPRQDAA